MKNLQLIILGLLISSLSFAQTIISGNVSGTWNLEGSPYIVTGNIYVVNQLFIEPGVLVKFQAGGWKIEVGPGDKFFANGNAENPIYFEPYQGVEPGSWDMIYFNSSGQDDTLSHCIVRYGTTGIYGYKSGPTIENSIIYGNSYAGIYFNARTGTFEGSVTGCTIRDNGAHGIHVEGYDYNGTASMIVVIDNCQIFNNEYNGILVYSGTYWSWGNAYSFANINNSTIYNNSTGVRAYAYRGYADAKLTNTIVAFNNYGVVNQDSKSFIGANDILYNCFWGNEGGDFSAISKPSGFGLNGYYQNFNGDSCDINFNIYNDPLFVDTLSENFNLQPSSKCIDAGTNIILGTFRYDPDGTVPDMGSKFYPHAETDILSYSFPQQICNSSINTDTKEITTEVIFGTCVRNLIADFNLPGGATATINGIEQFSGFSENDFSNPVTYTITAVEGDTEDWLVTVTVKQTLTLPAGWSGISSSIEPTNTNIESLFAPIVNNLIILQNHDGMYWPYAGVNTLGAWNSHAGYQVKMETEQELVIAGWMQDDLSLNLNEGWNYLPVLNACETPAAELFSQISGELIIAKEIAGGGVYWPQYGINTLGSVALGKAYFVLVAEEVEVVFQECTPIPAFPLKGEGEDPPTGTLNYTKEPSSSLSDGTPSPQGDGWGEVMLDEVTKTPLTHTIAIPAAAIQNSEIKPGDIIKAFDSEELCFGAVIWNSENTSITLYGDDPITYDRDGFTEGEMIRFRLYNAETKTENDLIVELDLSLPDSDAVFKAHGLSAISSLQMAATSVNEGIIEEIRIYPNPVKDVLHVDLGEQHTTSLNILNIHGQVVLSQTLTNQVSEINVASLTPGIYFVETSGAYKKLVVE